MAPACGSAPRFDIGLEVVLADPRLPFPDHPSGIREDHDRRDVARLASTLPLLADPDRTTFLDDHERLLDQLRNSTADLVLNFCNAGFRNRPELQMHVPALLELLGRPFAGADAASLAICHDKGAVHGIADAAGIPVPTQQVLRLRGPEPDLPDRYPALLKPNHGSGSMGIGTASVVNDDTEARRCLERLARERDAPAWMVAEEFLPGREFSVAVLGSESGTPACLPPIEIDFSDLPPGLPSIMTHASKADENSVYWQCVQLRSAELPSSDIQTMHGHARHLFERLGCRDYARFDFRTDNAGTPRLIDANAHPEWGPESMLARMAYLAGLTYEDFLGRIISSALSRNARRSTQTARAEHAHGPPPGIRLRPTHPQDMAFVQAAESAPGNREFVEQWSEADHLAALKRRDARHLIIEDAQGNPAGYLILEGLTDPDRSLLLRRIVVTRKGSGIGRQTVEAVQRDCFEGLGFRRLWLEVHEDNAGARRLYERCGFRVVRVIPADTSGVRSVRMAMTDEDYRRLQTPA